MLQQYIEWNIDTGGRESGMASQVRAFFKKYPTLPVAYSQLTGSFFVFLTKQDEDRFPEIAETIAAWKKQTIGWSDPCSASRYEKPGYAVREQVRWLSAQKSHAGNPAYGYPTYQWLHPVSVWKYIDQ